MLFFSAKDGGVLRFRVDFSLAPYANVSFFVGGDVSQDIPVHLSLRAEEGRSVTNSRLGGAWGEETFHLLPAGEEVEILLQPETDASPGKVRMRVGETVLLSRPAAEFSGLDDIQGLRIDGAIVPRSLQIEGAASRDRPLRGHLALLPRSLMIEGWGFDAGALVQDLQIVAEGQERPLHCVRFKAPEIAAREQAPCEEIGCLSVLPGWLTAAAGPDGVSLRLLVGGRDTGARLHVSRDELRRRVELAAQAASEDVAASVLTAEHAGRLWDELSPSARGMASRMAELRGLPDPAPRPAASRSMPSPDPIDAPFRAVGQALREGKSPAEALAEIGSFPREDGLRLVTALTDVFCARDAFPVLADWAEARALDAGEDLDARRWGAALPWLWRAGRPDEAGPLLVRLHLAPGWQVATAALGHWLQEALASTEHASSAAEDWCWLISRWTKHEKHRLSDRHMLKAAHVLLSHHGELEPETQEKVDAAILKAHGLSQAFWFQDLPTLSPRLKEGRAAFEEIRQALAAGTPSEAAETALDWFESQGHRETAVFRNALFGPLGVVTRPGESLSERLARASDPEGAALRLLAHPFGPEEDASLAPLARQGILKRYGATGLPQAPGSALQEEAARRAREVLSGQEKTTALLPLLETLAGPENVHAGFGLGLALLAGLARQKREAEAAELGDALIALRDASETLSEEIARVVPLRSARDTLSQAPGASARRVLKAFLPEGEIAPVLPGLPKGLPTPDPVFDALVCIVSCRPNLKTRIPAIEQAWADKLEALGIPYVVVVGDGDGTLRDGVLALDAPDDYDGLPEKSLALARWVLEHTPFAHLVKIDDDCFLNVDAFFHGWSFRKFDLHGRYLRRVPGQMDRQWHARAGKATEPDRSPEPSAYADGGSTYTLSRRAMAELTRASETPEGRALRLHSVMEDKLVGDLLAQAGIGPVEEDHVCTIRRRPGSERLPVPRWENGFFPSRATPTRQIHLDRREDQTFAAELLQKDTLWPKKVWPSGNLRLRYNSDTLELVSSPEKLRRTAEAPFAVIAVMRNEIGALDAFLEHYRGIGAESFLIADNLSDDGTLERLLVEPDVAVFTVDTDYDVGRFGVTWQRTLALEFRLGRWTMIADADELLVCEAEGGMPALLQEPAFAEADAVRVMLLDLYPKGALSDVALGSDPFQEAGYCDRVPFLEDWPGEGPFGSGPTWTSALRHRLLPGSVGDLYLAQKFALLRPQPWMQWAEGLHHLGDIRLAERDLLAGHFKYHAGFQAKAATEASRGRHWGGAREYRRYAELGESVTLWDAEHSVWWREAKQVRPFLATSDE